MDIYPGPYCEALKLNYCDIDKGNISVQCNTIKNGVILELRTHLKLDRIVISVIQILCDDLKGITPGVLRAKIKKLVENKKKIQSRKKVRGFAKLEDLLNADFRIVTKSKKITTLEGHEPTPDSELGDPEARSDTLPKPCSAASELNKNKKNTEKLSDIGSQCEEKESNKKNNLLQYEISKKSKTLNRVLDNISCAKSKLDVLHKKMGHYSVKNVKKREERHRKNLQVLRDSRRQIKKQKIQISSLSSKLDTLKATQCLTEKDCTSLLIEERKKRVAQKSLSHFKIRCSKLLRANKEWTQAMDICLKEQNAFIQTLETDIEEMSAKVSENVRTKEKDGRFSDNVRMCVIELSGLEVATQKVSPVMRCVAKHLFGKRLEKDDLPSSTTAQTIMDEGHFLGKKHISNELAAAEHWGLSRDGTTRKKQKIVDTSITLSSGSIISLGFNRVSRETACEIHKVTKSHLMELATIHKAGDGIETFIESSLKTLAFTMSDRASNEKRASRLLKDWRNEVMKEVDENMDESPILNFYCMAHVLLGFHSYACKDLQEYEKTLVNEYGTLGRDSLLVFRTWNGRCTALERTLRTTSKAFGPAGGHLGIRDLWEGFCKENGIKSLIGNYRDNRFNALFQTSAEVLLHRYQFLEVLGMVKNPNLKLKAVKADLKSEPIATMMQCFGLIYIKITGPFWNLITKSRISYLELHSPIQDIYTFLTNCEQNPSIILHEDVHWTEDRDDGFEDIFYVPNKTSLVECLSDVDGDQTNAFFSCVKVVASAMKRTVEKQLADFLPGGQLSGPPSDKDHERTRYAQPTNLGCEHHFGYLDRSQQKRPRASMHHHSTVQILKRNGPGMRNWLDHMSSDDRHSLMKTARKEGKDLRDKHLAKEKSVLQEIFEGKRKDGPERRDDSLRQDDEAAEENLTQQVLEQLPKTLTQTGDYLAVAYQDSWYPGVVEDTSNDSYTVRFMAESRKAGIFFWPDRNDVQKVNRIFVLRIGLVLEAFTSSGRLWKIPSFSEIQELYEKFCEVYFRPQ